MRFDMLTVCCCATFDCRKLRRSSQVTPKGIYDYDTSHKIYHYNDVIMGAIASQIISLTIVYSTVYSDADQRKYQSSASLAFVRGIHRWPVNSPHKWPVTRKMFPFHDVSWHRLCFALLYLVMSKRFKNLCPSFTIYRQGRFTGIIGGNSMIVTFSEVI